MKQTVLITGGTGMVGKALTRALVKKGYKVIILTRNVRGKEQQEQVQYAAWDVSKQQMDMQALQEADYIIHLAGAGVVEKKWTAAYKKEIQDSRTESSRLIIDSLKNNSGSYRNKVKAVISASAIGWYGADTEPVKPFTENDAADNSFLGHTCKLWEESIEPVTTMGKRLVKFRIGIVLSNEGGALVEFKKPLRFGVAGILGNGKQMVSWIHIDDLCNLFIAGIENESLSGSYNAVAPNPVSNKALTLTLAKAMKGKFYIPMPVPAFVLKIMMGQRSIEVLKSTTVSSKKIQDAGFAFGFKNIEAALQDLSAATGQR
ncbi:MAG: TIGR01777 family oxidoreductase [Ferruginibacter sp.]